MADFVKTRDLNERITFVEVKNGKNEHGEVEAIEKDVFSCWSSVQTLMMKDMVASMGTILEGTLTFVIRYYQDHEINNAMQIRWRNQIFSIVQVTKGEFKKDFTTIIAKEVS